MSIAFFTIIERKILGIFHIRLGPNKIGNLGILQPFSDAIKLFTKNLNNLSKINEFYWNISPLLTFLIFLLILIFLPIKIENNNFIFSILTLLFIIGIPSFTLFWRSFFSFRKFRIIRSKRCISQILSYEIGIMILLIFLFSIFLTINIENLIFKIYKIKNFKFLILIIFYVIILSETSRIPFDFIEGESELVSGFNIEYSSSYFSLFFIYEYGIILFFCILIRLIFNKFLISFILIYFFILIRASFPRFRYDQIIIFFWKYVYTVLICIILIIKTFFLN